MLDISLMYDILKKNEEADMNGKYLKLLLASVSVFFLLAETSAKPIASVEYFYATDGTLTGRAVNGKLQQYQYDKKGQLVAVVDALSRRIVEHYVYDPAGNILSKTVNEKTTTYIYDKANQLISSTCEGKVTKYQYDAAGRMVKEGEKSYRYGYLDKILEIQENGRQVAAFDYHMDGQIASAMYGDKSEDFLWDGLALIHRGATNFINEPYVTGGNPILSSKDGVMFNDMLGNSLNIGGRDIVITAFGETESVEAMFTGKPYIGGLGYTFLYRNYRADQGKWQTTDPLGYPDGWNNFAYVNNAVSMNIDWLGSIALEASSKLSFSAASVWQSGYTPSVSFDSVEVKGNDNVKYEILLTADGNNSGITGISATLHIISSQSFGLTYIKDGKTVWTQSNIAGTAVLASTSIAQTTRTLGNGDKIYTATVTFYVYEKVSAANYQGSAPRKTYTLTLTHTVKE